MYLFLDTETNGLPKTKNMNFVKEEDWPNLIEVAWQLYTADERLIYEKQYLVFPNGFSIDRDSYSIHGISDTMARTYGHPLSFVLGEFVRDLDKAKYFVGHSPKFDIGVLKAELTRCGFPIDIFDDKEVLCTMLLGTNYCEIPTMSGSYKWPKLGQLYKALFKEDFTAHRAMSDIRACSRCFFELKKIGYV